LEHPGAAGVRTFVAAGGWWRLSFEALACTPIEDQSMIARAKALVAAALLLGGAAACSDITGNNVNAEGQFFLITVDGTQVPYSYTDANNNNVFLQSDTYVLNTDGSYSDNQVSRVNGSTQSLFEFGSWSQNGNTVVFRPNQSDFDPNLTPYQATVRNSNQFGGDRTLTISLNGITAIYSDDGSGF
jgi:hypothetical protein